MGVGDLVWTRLFGSRSSRVRAEGMMHLPHLLHQTGYFHVQATVPETLAYALTDSPVGLAAWIIDKFQAWSDPSQPLSLKFSVDDLLTNIMLYYLSGSIVSSMRLYKEEFATPESVAVQRKYRNVLQITEHQAGGLFAALERPLEL